MTDLDPETTEWKVLFNARGGLTCLQVQALSTAASHERPARDFAFLLETTPSASGRVLGALARKGLVYYDYVGGDQGYMVKMTRKGEDFIRDHGVPT